MLWLVVLAGWGFFYLVFPKVPGYEETMKHGEPVPGKIVRIEEVQNIKINSRHPRRVWFEYGDGKQGNMMIAMKAKVREDRQILVRVLGEQAYPEGIQPLTKPSWLKFVFGAGIVLGGLMIASGVFRLVLLGGLVGGGLLAAKKVIDDKKQPPPPPPPAPPV